MTDLDAKLFKLEEYYHYLESSFVDVTRIIPLENTSDTFSPRLYEILQSVCSQVDGIVKLMHEECMSACDKSTAARYKILNHEGVFSYQSLVYKSRPEWKEIRPFSCDFRCMFREEYDDPHENVPSDKIPKWWNDYNSSKHDLPEGYEAGSIENTYLALAGLYVLHTMMRQYPRNKSDFLKRNAWTPHNLLVLGGERKYFMERNIVEPPSKIFISGRWLVPGKD